MFIQTTRQPKKAPQSIVKSVAPSSSDEFRPKEDSWIVGQDSFSTADLLDNDVLPTEGTRALYKFRLKDDDAQARGRNRIFGTALGALGGGAFGVTAVGGLALLGEALNIVSSGPYYNPSSGLSSSVVLAGMAVAGAAGLVGGAFLGGSAGESISQQSREKSVFGTLHPKKLKNGDSTVIFYPGQKKKDVKGVDLRDYLGKSVLPPVAIDSRPVWKDALAGAAIGAVASPAHLTPIGLVGSLVAGLKVGGALSGEEFYGAGLGAAASVATTSLITYGSISALGVPAGLAVAAGIMGLGGAALGPAVLPSIRENQALENQLAHQWWSREAKAQRDA